MGRRTSRPAAGRRRERVVRQRVLCCLHVRVRGGHVDDPVQPHGRLVLVHVRSRVPRCVGQRLPAVLRDAVARVQVCFSVSPPPFPARRPHVLTPRESAGAEFGELLFPAHQVQGGPPQLVFPARRRRLSHEGRLLHPPPAAVLRVVLLRRAPDVALGAAPGRGVPAGQSPTPSRRCAHVLTRPDTVSPRTRPCTWRGALRSDPGSVPRRRCGAEPPPRAGGR